MTATQSATSSSTTSSTLRGTTRTEPTAREARKVAEAAREQDWTKPSFGKELFLGRLRLDLIDPWPTPTPETKQRGEDFLARARTVADGIDGQQTLVADLVRPVDARAF